MLKPRRLFALAIAVPLLLLPAAAQAAQAPSGPGAGRPGAGLRTIDHFVLHRSTVPVIAGQPVHLYVEEKVLAKPKSAPSRGAVLFVHGATYPSNPDFDLQYQDYSWMEFLARAGFDVYGMDMEGYGKSSRPWPMDDPCNLRPADQQLLIPSVISAVCPPSYPSLLTTNQSDWADLDSVVDFIRGRTGVSRVNLIGWSQGGTRTGGYAALHPNKVDKLVAFAPAYDRTSAGPQPTQPAGAAFAIQDHDAFLARWNSEVSCPNQVDPAAQEAMWRQNLASDEVASTWGQGFIRRPNNSGGGWNAALAARVRAPALLISGDLDDTVPSTRVRDLYDDLGSRQKMFILAHCGSHFALLEKEHRLLQNIVLSWLVQGRAVGQQAGIVSVGGGQPPQ